MKKAEFSDKILIEGIKCEAILGVYPEERHERRTVIFDICCQLDATRSAQSDDLRDTMDYGRVVEQVISVASGTSFRLIEALAEKIARTVLEFPAVQQVTVKLTKPGAVPDCDAVSIEIRRGK